MFRKNKLIFLFATSSLILSACSTQMTKSSDQMQMSSNGTGQLTEATNNGPVGGGAAGSMDELDQSKLSHALDGGLGKATSWENASTGTKFTVVPTQKLTINGNPFCRKYKVTTERSGNTNESSGTACVATDGAWHPA